MDGRDVRASIENKKGNCDELGKYWKRPAKREHPWFREQSWPTFDVEIPCDEWPSCIAHLNQVFLSRKLYRTFWLYKIKQAWCALRKFSRAKAPPKIRMAMRAVRGLLLNMDHSTLLQLPKSIIWKAKVYASETGRGFVPRWKAISI